MDIHVPPKINSLFIVSFVANDNFSANELINLSTNQLIISALLLILAWIHVLIQNRIDSS